MPRQPLYWPSAFMLAGNAFARAMAQGRSMETAFALFVSTYTACYLTMQTPRNR